MSSSLSLFLVLLASPAFSSETPKPVIPAPSEIVLSIDGKIYPDDQIPAECKDMLHDVKCTVKPYGIVHIESKKEGDITHSKTVFSDEDGPQVTEESWEKDGHVQRSTVDNRGINKFMELEVVGNKVHYKVTDKKDNSVKTSEDDADSNLVVPSTVMAFVRPHFTDIANGHELKLRVAVLDRREAFSFVIKKLRDDKTASGEPIEVLQMSPGSFIVKALVDPMYFYMKPKTGEMYGFEGKSSLRHKEGDKYKEMVVKTMYEYLVNKFPAPGLPVVEGSANCSDDLNKDNSMKCSVPGTTPKDASNENKTSVHN